jgi:hypothetical protein
MPESVAFGLLTFLLGLIVGHRMTLWRERRKEFNEVAARVRVALKSRSQNLRPYFGTAGKIAATDMELFEHLLGRWHRPGFRRAWANYEAACKETVQDTLGRSSYPNPEAISAALERVVLFTALR